MRPSLRPVGQAFGLPVDGASGPAINPALRQVRLARKAMATRFEIVLHGSDAATLRAAGEEALDEICRLESRLSLFQPSSEIAHLNARAAAEPIRVTPATFALLKQAKELHQESGGAFDITIAPLVRCWGFMGGTGRRPQPDALTEARRTVGMNLLHLDEQNLTVRFERQGVMLDLGAIGKGYAIERAAGLLREAGVTSALLHGGTSTVYALGCPPDAASWKVAIEDPRQSFPPPGARGSLPASRHGTDGSGLDGQAPQTGVNTQESSDTRDSRLDTRYCRTLAVIPLKDEALSVSGIRGKCFEENGELLGHILDPCTGQPAMAAELAAVILPSATETDALSTALLIRGAEGHDQMGKLRPGMKSLLAFDDGRGQLRIQTKGLWANDPA